MAGHTPGPWKVEKSHNGGAYSLRYTHPVPVVQVGGRRWVPTTTTNVEPDARLIAAAPDLLDALKEVLPYVESLDPEQTIDSFVPESVEAAQAAIAKAEGRDA